MPKPQASPPAPTQDDLVFKALAGSDRRRILDLLKSGPRPTSAIADELPWLNRCTVMQHLGVLEEAGLVVSSKRGRSRWNYLDVGPIQAIHERWIGDYAQPSAAFLNRLKTDLEETAER